MDIAKHIQLQGMMILFVSLCLQPSSAVGAGSEYAIISKKNLFRPDRSEWISDKHAGNDAAEKTDPERLELFGTIIIGDRRSALIYEEKKPAQRKPTKSSRSRAGRNRMRKKAKLYHPGDYLGSYIVSAIDAKQVELDYYGEKEILYLHEGKEPPKGDYTPLGVSQPRQKKAAPQKKPVNRKTRSRQQQRQEAMQRELAAGKVPVELKNVLAPEQLKKLLTFNKRLMREMKESGGNLDQRAIKERIEAFRERFLESM